VTFSGSPITFALVRRLRVSDLGNQFEPYHGEDPGKHLCERDRDTTPCPFTAFAFEPGHAPFALSRSVDQGQVEEPTMKRIMPLTARGPLTVTFNELNSWMISEG